MTFFVAGVLILYLLLILLFWIGWERIGIHQPNESFTPEVSVIIAVRNEVENIDRLLKALNAQVYPAQKLEILFVDDHSTDDTYNRIQAYINSAKISISLFRLGDQYGKKAALRKGVDAAKGDIILTTDGDCSMTPNWVSALTLGFENPDVQMVSGPVSINPTHSFFQRWQAIEFSSLISAGAATLVFGYPTMANAANMAFRKEVYPESSNTAGRSISSGDDIFLLHTIGKIKGAVAFCMNQEAIVSTVPAATISAFYNQRKRWAGKWTAYKSSATKLLAIFIFLVNLITLILPLMVYLDQISWLVALNLFLAKVFFEYWFLRDVQKFFKTRVLLPEFIILAIIYPLYVVFTAITATTTGYGWKDRKHNDSARRSGN
jgi:biofilm PGA synthesis N-glycosyltransferase PgaC